MLHALQFLTVLPVGRLKDQPLGRSAWAFPFVGLLLGLLVAAMVRLPLGPLLAIIALALITGALHEDGLADVFDAVRANRSRERMLEILKDSRIGAHGALALIAGFALRWQALVLLRGDPWIELPAVFGISRGMLVLLAAWSPVAAGSEGLGRHFSDSMPRWTPLAVLLLMIGLGVAGGVYIIAANAALLLLLRWWFVTRLGGITGDCLGAACQMSEAVSLVVLACL